MPEDIKLEVYPRKIVVFSPVSGSLQALYVNFMVRKKRMLSRKY